MVFAPNSRVDLADLSSPVWSCYRVYYRYIVGGPDVVEVLLSEGVDGRRHAGDLLLHELEGLFDSMWRTERKGHGHADKS